MGEEAGNKSPRQWKRTTWKNNFDATTTCSITCWCSSRPIMDGLDNLISLYPFALSSH